MSMGDEEEVFCRKTRTRRQGPSNGFSNTCQKVTSDVWLRIKSMESGGGGGGMGEEGKLSGLCAMKRVGTEDMMTVGTQHDSPETMVMSRPPMSLIDKSRFVAWLQPETVMSVVHTITKGYEDVPDL